MYWHDYSNGIVEDSHKKCFTLKKGRKTKGEQMAFKCLSQHSVEVTYRGRKYTCTDNKQISTNTQYSLWCPKHVDEYCKPHRKRICEAIAYKESIGGSSSGHTTDNGHSNTGHSNTGHTNTGCRDDNACINSQFSGHHTCPNLKAHCTGQSYSGKVQTCCPKTCGKCSSGSHSTGTGNTGTGTTSGQDSD
jgi:hypothetical protein